MLLDKYLINSRIRTPIVLAGQILFLLPVILIVELNNYNNPDGEEYIVDEDIFTLYWCITFFMVLIVEAIGICRPPKNLDSLDAVVLLQFFWLELIDTLKHFIVLLFFGLYDIYDFDNGDRNMRVVTGVLMMLDMTVVGIVVLCAIIYGVFYIFRMVIREIKKVRSGSVEQVDE